MRAIFATPVVKMPRIFGMPVATMPETSAMLVRMMLEISAIERGNAARAFLKSAVARFGAGRVIGLRHLGTTDGRTRVTSGTTERAMRGISGIRGEKMLAMFAIADARNDPNGEVALGGRHLGRGPGMEQR